MDWRLCVLLAMLFVVPARAATEAYEEEEEDDTSKEDKEDLEEEEEEAEPRKRSLDVDPGLAKLSARPLECYVCSYKTDAPLRACLDPVKYRSHVAVCRSPLESCYTTAAPGERAAVLRGCRAGCVSAAELRCCNDRCNSDRVAPPVPALALGAEVRLTPASSKSCRAVPPSVLFFVTVLLLLQTVAKVSL